MIRRRVLRGALAIAAGLLLSGHTPYRQWVVYRKKHLLIGCHRADPETYDLAKRAVALLEEHLPAARARVARAPDARRLASLLGTGQMEVATLDAADARAMLEGTGRFVPYGPLGLRLLTPLGGRLLVCRADVPERHAWLVTGALTGTELAEAVSPTLNAAVPWHPGSRAFLEGRPEPEDD